MPKIAEHPQKSPLEHLRSAHSAILSLGNSGNSDDASEILKYANEIGNWAKAEIARTNRTEPRARVVEKWKSGHGVDPVKFYAMALLFDHMLKGDRTMAKAHRAALLVQRPDLQPKKWKGRAEDRKAAVRNLVGNLREFINSPRADFNATLPKIKADFDKLATQMTAAQFFDAVVCGTEAHRLGLALYTFAGTKTPIWVTPDELRQIKADEKEWKPGGAEYGQALTEQRRNLVGKG